MTAPAAPLTRATGRAGVMLLLACAVVALCALSLAIGTRSVGWADLTAGLLQALSMPEEEATGRMRQLFGSVEYHDVDRWGRGFLEAVRG